MATRAPRGMTIAEMMVVSTVVLGATMTFVANYLSTYRIQRQTFEIRTVQKLEVLAKQQAFERKMWTALVEGNAQKTIVDVWLCAGGTCNVPGNRVKKLMSQPLGNSKWDAAGSSTTVGFVPGALPDPATASSYVQSAASGATATTTIAADGSSATTITYPAAPTQQAATKTQAKYTTEDQAAF